MAARPALSIRSIWRVRWRPWSRARLLWVFLVDTIHLARPLAGLGRARSCKGLPPSDLGVWAGNARCRPNFFAARRHDDRNAAARSAEWTRAVLRSKNRVTFHEIALKSAGLSAQENDEDPSFARHRALVGTESSGLTPDLNSKNPRPKTKFAGRRRSIRYSKH